MYSHQVHKTPKPIKFHWEWGALLALVILAAAAIYLVATNTPTTTTQSVAPAMVNKPVQSNMMEASTRGVLGYINAHDQAFQQLKDPAMTGIMGYIKAHEVDPFSQAIVTEPAAKSVLDYLRAHDQ